MEAVRSMLFVPGHRSDLIAKAARSAADAVIIDLEDGVAESVKDAARTGLDTLPEVSPNPSSCVSTASAWIGCGRIWRRRPGPGLTG